MLPIHHARRPRPRWLLCLLLAAVAAALAGPPAAAATDVGGDILVDTTWDAAGSPYVVVAPVFVLGGATLTVLPGTEVRLKAGMYIIVDHSTLVANGTADSMIVFTRNEVNQVRWGAVAGYFATMTFHHCIVEWGKDVTYAGIYDEGLISNAGAGSSTVVEDCILRNGGRDGIEIEGGSITFRRNLVENVTRQGYNSFEHAQTICEDNRVEHCGNDGYDITNVDQNELVFRNNVAIDSYGSGADGLDIDHWGYGSVSGFEAYDIQDKGVTVSTNSLSVVVENSIVVNCGKGYSVVDNGNLSVFNSVAYGCGAAFAAYQQDPPYNGGDIVVVNSIAWNSGIAVLVDTASTATIVYSILDTPEPYPGVGNLNSNPRFYDAAGRDFRLLANSPAIDAGYSGGTPEFDIRGHPRVDVPWVPDTGGGFITYFDIGAFEFDPETTGADGSPRVAGAPRFGLRAFPSPGTGRAGIAFELPGRRDVEVGVYDAVGRLVERVYHGPLEAGRHELGWGGAGGAGASGLYFIRLRAGDDVAVEKLVRVR